MGLPSERKIEPTHIQQLAYIISEHLVVCNQKELTFLVNEYLEEHELPTVNEKNFIKFLKGKEVPPEVADNPMYIQLERLIIKTNIEKKKDLMDKYLTENDWKEMKRGEFLFATRFASFGQEEREDAVQVEGSSHITINIDARKIELAQPITSESQMLDISEDAVAKYLGKRGLLTQAQEEDGN